MPKKKVEPEKPKIQPAPKAGKISVDKIQRAVDLISKPKKKIAKKVLKPGSKDGRPEIYSKELSDYVCHIVATHTAGLPVLCKQYPKMPSEALIYEWRYKYPDFVGNYARAKLKQAEIMAEEIVQISDDASRDDSSPASVARARLMVDTRKWIASKLLPKAYGDRGIVEELKSSNDEMMKELLALRAELAKKNKRDF